MHRQNTAVLFICLLAGTRYASTQDTRTHGIGTENLDKYNITNVVASYLNQYLGDKQFGSPSPPSVDKIPPLPPAPAQAPGASGVPLPTTPAGAPDNSASVDGINSGDLNNIAYLFGVYQDTGPTFGAAVYTDNVTTQYIGTRDANENPTNLTSFRVIKSTRASTIEITESGVSITNENGTLSVGIPQITADGQNVTVNYLLVDFTSTLTINFTTSMPLTELAAGGAYDLSGRNGRKLLDATFCAKAAAAASAVCTALGFPKALSADRLGSVGLYFKNFFAAQAARIGRGEVVAVLVTGLAAPEAVPLVAGAFSVAASIYGALATACAIYKVVAPIAGAAGLASFLANTGPCRPAQGACDDNGNDDIC